jgi:hypothetical protein
MQSHAKETIAIRGIETNAHFAIYNLFRRDPIQIKGIIWAG